MLIELTEYNFKNPVAIRSEMIDCVRTVGEAYSRTCIWIRGNTAPIEVVESYEQVKLLMKEPFGHFVYSIRQAEEYHKMKGGYLIGVHPDL